MGKESLEREETQKREKVSERKQDRNPQSVPSGKEKPDQKRATL
jgi:hypothetical protein